MSFWSWLNAEDFADELEDEHTQAAMDYLASQGLNPDGSDALDDMANDEEDYSI